MPGKSIAKVGGKAIRFIAVARCVKNYASQFARGLSPGERRLFDGIQMPFVPGSFWGCSWSDPFRAWRLGEKPSSGVPSPRRGSLGLTRRSKDAKTDGELRDCPLVF
jgi:hypothetical protein